MSGASFLSAMASFRSTQTLLDNATGTSIGSAFVGGGGFVSVFDKNTNQALAAGGRHTPQPAWAGKYFAGAPKIWSGFTVYSPNNNLISGNAGGRTGTWEFYVKTTGQSTSDTDGTMVGSGTWADPSSFTSQYTVQSLTVTPTFGESAFVRLRFIATPADDVNVAELQLYYEV